MRTARSLTETRTLEALFPGPKRWIFCALFGAPERWWSLVELAGMAGLQPRSLRPHITHLRAGGILEEKVADGHASVQANHSSPVFAELQSIVTKLTDAATPPETILIVEDQPATAQITRILLESWGYQVLEAHCAPEAMEIFDTHRESIGLLLSDVKMPGMSGPQLADELLRQRPDLRVVFMSGAHEEAPLRADTAFLPKPFNPASLSRIVRRQLDRRSAGT
ncbi:MAG: hypothetical protein C5B51_05045 [Terriglobia bacterium]|nr:MAG: hypothetical protein C5B51_05045 [Terriglobia bacterium]